MIKDIQFCLPSVGDQFRFCGGQLSWYLLSDAHVWLGHLDDTFKSTRPGSRWCQSTFNEDLLFGLALLSVPSVGTLGCAITVNKVIQPWCDLESEIKARGGCSESSLRIPLDDWSGRVV